MRREMFYKYLLVGIFMYLLNLFYQAPHRIPRFLMIVGSVIVLGTLIERLYYYMLARKRIGVVGRLIITIPIGVIFMIIIRVISGKTNGYYLYITIMTIIGVVILDQINYQIYKHNYDQANKKLDVMKKNATHQ